MPRVSSSLTLDRREQLTVGLRLHNREGVYFLTFSLSEKEMSSKTGWKMCLKHGETDPVDTRKEEVGKKNRHKPLPLLHP